MQSLSRFSRVFPAPVAEALRDVNEDCDPRPDPVISSYAPAPLNVGVYRMKTVETNDFKVTNKNQPSDLITDWLSSHIQYGPYMSI